MFASVKRILQSIGAFPGAVVERLTSKWVVVVGHSMYPTLQDRQRVRVSRRAYRIGSPARWDVAFFEHPNRDRFWETKRVIGLPGESVLLENGRLYLNGIEIDEPFIFGVQPRINRQWQLQANEYILFGDNRRRSTDSRQFGPVPRNRIAGKVVLPESGPVDHQ